MGGGTNDRSAVPTCHGLRSTSVQQAKTRRPPAIKRRRTAAKAASRFVEEHHPELAHGDVEGADLAGAGLHVHLDEPHVPTARVSRPLACQLKQWSRDVDTDHLSSGCHGSREGQAEGGATTADIADRLAGSCVDHFEQQRRDGVRQPLAVRPGR